MKKSLSLGILFLFTSIISAQATKAQSSNQLFKADTSFSPYYSIAFGVNALDNGAGKLPLNGDYSFKTPFFLTAERRFTSKLSAALTLSTNQLPIASVDKFYFSIDAVGQFYFNEYLFNSKKIEMYAGLGLGRFFLENNGNNTLNLIGGGRYWFSNDFGVSLQGVGKVGLAPLNTAVRNHYQYNLGLVWRSNHNKVKAVDDVSKLKEIKKQALIQEQELSGKRTKKETGLTLPDPKLTIGDQSQNSSAEKVDGRTKEQKSIIAKETATTDLAVVTQNAACDYKIGKDLGKCLGIKMINFTADKYFSNSQAALDLEKILSVLNQYPTLKLDIRSHTDCRQTEKFNQDISQKRANATMNWLVKQGIDTLRLTAKGYGQSQLLNSCNCLQTQKSNCTELQHQENRRNEFIITAL